ncbi:MAG: tetratricopeptide repeat protein [Cyanobacteria bacterium REEB67]|nr:tetratricopeptide repeat protein [Cyanobacteria bacterium REEB67]
MTKNNTPQQSLMFSLFFCGLFSGFLADLSSRPALAFDEAKWAICTHDGQKAFEISDFGTAEKNFLAALTQLKGASDADKTAHLADSLTSLGILYSSRGQFAKAEPFFEKALKVKEYVGGSRDKGTIGSQVKLCQLYLSQGKRDKAMPLVDKLTDYGESQARELAEMSNSYVNLLHFNKTHKKVDAAALAQEETQLASLKALKSKCQDVAILLDSTAGSIKEINTEHSHTQAERLYKSALAMRQRTLTPEHAALASSLENLGKLYQAEGKTTRAEPLLRRAYEISLDTLGPDRAETAQRLDTLAQVLSSAGKLSEAEALYRQVLDYHKPQAGSTAATAAGKAGNGGGRNQADMAANMATLLVKQGRYGEAVPYYSRALKIQESINGPQSASLLNLLDSYAYALSRANRSGEAQRLTARARSIRG